METPAPAGVRTRANRRASPPSPVRAAPRARLRRSRPSGHALRRIVLAPRPRFSLTLRPGGLPVCTRAAARGPRLGPSGPHRPARHRQAELGVRLTFLPPRRRSRCSALENNQNRRRRAQSVEPGREPSAGPGRRPPTAAAPQGAPSVRPPHPAPDEAAPGGPAPAPRFRLRPRRRDAAPGCECVQVALLACLPLGPPRLCRPLPPKYPCADHRTVRGPSFPGAAPPITLGDCTATATHEAVERQTTDFQAEEANRQDREAFWESRSCEQGRK